MTKRLSVVVSEDRTPRPESGAMLRAVVSQLARRTGIDVILVPHLYDLSPEGPVFARLRAIEGDLVALAWLYPRATYWLLAANGVRGRFGRTSMVPVEEMPDEPARSATDGGPGPARAVRHEEPGQVGAAEPRREAQRTVWCIDLRAIEHPRRLLDEIDRIALEATGVVPPVAAPQTPAETASETTSEAPLEELAAEPGQPAAGDADQPAERLVESTRRRWYPVVDYDRCQGCLECLNFCLFGVFGLDQAGALLVEQADACRDGCPACARVCPSGAIMFPLHPNPAIAGDPTLPLGAFQQDLVQFLGGTAGRPSSSELARAVAASERERFVARSRTAPQGESSDAPGAGTQPISARGISAQPISTQPTTAQPTSAPATGAPGASTPAAAELPAADSAAPSDAPDDAKPTPHRPTAPNDRLDALVDRLDQSDL